MIIIISNIYIINFKFIKEENQIKLKVTIFKSLKIKKINVKK